ncbi:hypothetical protein [Herbaspirillum sp. RV1423]|uniref:hypothetical protein n=1 Tax=Herbaspirillum sp. RV1423 TaxID=1443993 RepID=UPI0005596B8B|nr:hypothetical protein [Herbaspirillum sp. RV1423]
MAANDSTKEVLLDAALPGMMLAEAVLDKAGARLISPGVELTAKSIEALRQRGVRHVRVERPATDEEQSRSLVQALQRLDVLFQTSQDSAPNQLLLDCLRSYRTRRAQ